MSSTALSPRCLLLSGGVRHRLGPSPTRAVPGTMQPPTPPPPEPEQRSVRDRFRGLASIPSSGSVPQPQWEEIVEAWLCAAEQLPATAVEVAAAAPDTAPATWDAAAVAAGPSVNDCVAAVASLRKRSRDDEGGRGVAAALLRCEASNASFVAEWDAARVAQRRLFEEPPGTWVCGSHCDA